MKQNNWYTNSLFSIGILVFLYTGYALMTGELLHRPAIIAASVFCVLVSLIPFRFLSSQYFTLDVLATVFLIYQGGVVAGFVGNILETIAVFYITSRTLKINTFRFFASIGLSGLSTLTVWISNYFIETLISIPLILELFLSLIVFLLSSMVVREGINKSISGVLFSEKVRLFNLSLLSRYPCLPL